MTHHERVETGAAPGTPQRASLADGVRLAYASLGLFSVMSDEVEAFYEKCVTRGEQRGDRDLEWASVLEAGGVIGQPK